MPTVSSRPAPARERILDAARRLVLEHGFAATTLDAVLADAGASKGAFFHHFPTKAALGRALVEQYAQADEHVLEEHMSAAEAGSDDAAEQLIAFLRGFEEATDDLLAVQPSCLFVSFIYETELADAGTDGIVLESVMVWRHRILTKLNEAAKRHPRLRELDLTALADQVFTVFEGAFLLARATGDPTAVRRQLAHLRRYVELLCSD